MPIDYARKIQENFIERKLTLSLAESCTGGAIAARLTKIPGCSNYFLGSVVAYSNQLKTQLLAVEASLIAQYGAVSGPVVQQMAQGVLNLTQSSYSLAVSGIAGPDGGTPNKPVGTIWAAIYAEQGLVEAWSFHLAGNREEIIEQAVQVLLAHLYGVALR